MNETTCTYSSRPQRFTQKTMRKALAALELERRAKQRREWEVSHFLTASMMYGVRVTGIPLKHYTTS